MDPFNTDDGTDDAGSSLELAPDQIEQPQAPLPAAQPDYNYNKAPRPKRLIVILPVVVLVIALIFLAILIFNKPKATKKPVTNVVINTQSLSAGTLSQIENQLGSSQLKQQLTITPDTLFKNNVDVQGNLQVSGTSSLQSAVTVGSNLLVNGSLTVGGSTNLAGNLNVSGLISAASISVGMLNINNIDVGGNFSFGGHLIPSGADPTGTPDLASGNGSVVVNGNDTSGTVTINVGSGAVHAGQMAIIHFHSAFNLSPEVQLTPTDAAAASLQYYSESAPTFFSINTGTSPANGTSYTFNYLVTQ